ncbi:MAG: T9SS type A sorting domain-containing protein [Flavobacteriia bacterium]|jgi:hypothetical protein
MKKIILSISAVLLLSVSNLNAQFSISVENSTIDISGSAHEVTYTSIVPIQIKFKFTNLGATNDFILTRVKEPVPSGWTDGLCWGELGDPFGLCYGAGQMPTNPWSTPLAVNLSTNEVGELKTDIFLADNAAYGTGRYRYYIGRTADNPIDSVDLIVNYGVASVSKKDANTNFLLYPNPADNQIQITLPSNVAEGTVKIADVLGKIVYEEKVLSSKKVNTEEFKNGVYILSFNSNGTTYTKRFVVKH